MKNAVSEKLKRFSRAAAWRFHLCLAHLGFHKYDGAPIMAGSLGYPLGRVVYPDSAVSMPMALGNAVEYAEIHEGRVVPVEEEAYPARATSNANVNKSASR